MTTASIGPSGLTPSDFLFSQISQNDEQDSIEASSSSQEESSDTSTSLSMNQLKTEIEKNASFQSKVLLSRLEKIQHSIQRRHLHKENKEAAVEFQAFLCSVIYQLCEKNKLHMVSTILKNYEFHDKLPTVCYAKGLLYQKGLKSTNKDVATYNKDDKKSVLCFLKSAEQHKKSFAYIGQIFRNTKQVWNDKFIGNCFLYLASKEGIGGCPPSLRSQDDETIVAQLVTKVTYQAKRHPWDSFRCRRIRQLVETMDPSFKEKDQKFYEIWIRQHETDTQDYYGLKLSSDSDVEEEKHFQKGSHYYIGKLESHFEKLINKAEGNRFELWLDKFATDTSAADDVRKITEYFHQCERLPERSAHDSTIERDLGILNHFAAQNQLAEGIKSITTQFVVAQYRGIAYETTQWNAQRRREHRELNEIDTAYYSAGVYDLAQVAFHEEWSDETQERLQKSATELREKLIQLRSRDPEEKRSNQIAYGSRANQIQEIYSRNKDAFMEELETLDLGTVKNPFVSTGDTPFHALKYAYGIKPYKEHRDERLRPRWKKNGLAERPYSGKVYLSLHPVDDYEEKSGPLHVPSLNTHGIISLDPRILNERESTFPGYIPENRIKYTYVAKYPSFKGEYKKIYLYKYGLKKSAYDKLQALFMKHGPHSKENRAVKAILGEFLCAYHEVRLQEKAQELAEKMGEEQHVKTVLIYRTEYGFFSLTRPVYVFPNNSATNPVHRADLQGIRRRKEQRNKSAQLENPR